jgi:hypothetical protein
MHACYENSKEYFEAQQAIDRALTEALWRSNRVDVSNINAPDYGDRSAARWRGQLVS